MKTDGTKKIPKWKYCKITKCLLKTFGTLVFYTCFIFKKLLKIKCIPDLKLRLIKSLFKKVKNLLEGKDNSSVRKTETFQIHCSLIICLFCHESLQLLCR